jgi:hypothetical protein
VSIGFFITIGIWFRLQTYIIKIIIIIKIEYIFKIFYIILKINIINKVIGEKIFYRRSVHTHYTSDSADFYRETIAIESNI